MKKNNPQGKVVLPLSEMAAGSIIELSVAIKNHTDNPTSILITVWVH